MMPIALDRDDLEEIRDALGAGEDLDDAICRRCRRKHEMALFAGDAQMGMVVPQPPDPDAPGFALSFSKPGPIITTLQ
jgi:hypothetical protein